MDKIEMVINEVVDIKVIQKFQMQQNAMSQLLQIRAMFNSGALTKEEAISMSRNVVQLLQETKLAFSGGITSNTIKKFYKDIMKTYKSSKEVDDKMLDELSEDLL